MTGAVNPVCPFDECTCGSMLSSTDKAIRNSWLKANYLSKTLVVWTVVLHSLHNPFSNSL